MPVVNPTLRVSTAQPSRASVRVLLCGTGLALGAFAARAKLGLTPAYPYVVVAGFAAAGVLVVLLAGRYLRGRSFGAANQVTLLRAALAALLLGLAGESAADAAAWFAVGIAVPALLLDGVDGWLARRLGIASDFGARFDMETDAALILVLSLLAWQFGKAGAWVLLAGLMRYGFVAAGFALPWLRRSLPVSRRRQTVCVLQGVALLLCLAPWLHPPLSGGVALVGVVSLCWSFAVDLRWLIREARRAP
jgi:phosphatidylglycerophosphate synthase